jgi:hypothetical protein
MSRTFRIGLNIDPTDPFWAQVRVAVLRWAHGSSALV